MDARSKTRSVTDKTGGNSRNGHRGYGWIGGPREWWTPGAWCEQPIDPNMGEYLYAHHYHCERCGACLSVGAGPYGAKGVRADRVFCSNACRQAAWRARQKDAR